MEFIEEVQDICEQVFKLLKTENLKFRPMRRLKKINTKRSYVLGRTNLRTKMITIDIFTPINRKPKKVSSILRVLCHEIAHHQKPPYRQFYKFRWITRQHYPKFYKQVEKNILKCKNDEIIGKYFK